MSLCVHIMCICGSWRKTSGILLFGFPSYSLGAGNLELTIFRKAGFNTLVSPQSWPSHMCWQPFLAFYMNVVNSNLGSLACTSIFFPLSYLPCPQQQLLTSDSQTVFSQMLQLTLKTCSLAWLFVILITINNNINNRWHLLSLGDRAR